MAATCKFSRAQLCYLNVCPPGYSYQSGTSCYNSCSATSGRACGSTSGTCQASAVCTDNNGYAGESCTGTVPSDTTLSCSTSTYTQCACSTANLCGAACGGSYSFASIGNSYQCTGNGGAICQGCPGYVAPAVTAVQCPVNTYSSTGKDTDGAGSGCTECPSGATAARGSTACTYPSPPPSLAITSLTYVAAVVTLSGYTTSTFGTAQANAFKLAVAGGIQMPASSITITSVLSASLGRHLLQSGVNVAFTVTVAMSSVSEAAMTAALSSLPSSPSALSTLQSAGLTACTGVALVGTPGATTTVPTDATSYLPVTTLSSSGTTATAVRTSVSPQSCVAPSSCAYQCAAGYVVSTTGNTVIFTPANTPAGCVCYTGTSSNAGSGVGVTVSFQDGSSAIATGLSGCTLSVAASTQGVMCTGTYTVTGISGCTAGNVVKSAAPSTCAASALTLAAAAAVAAF